jgi:hypothetical protein
MLYYVAHKYGGDPANVEKAKKITHDLQVNDLENCYICPLNMFSHINYNEIGYDEELRLCFDVLTRCDVLLVASSISNGVRREIEMAEKHNLKIIYIRGDVE